MADYRKMYYQLAGQVSRAIELLIQAEQEAEETYMSWNDEIVLTSVADQPEKSQEQEGRQH